MRNLASTRSRSCLLPRVFPLTVALMLLLSLGWLVAPAPAAAQDDDEPFADAGVSGSSYESPTFGYTLEWDDEVWVVEEAETSDDNDFLFLVTEASDLYFESYERFDGDVVDCLDNAVSSIEDDERVTEFEVIDEDADDSSAFANFSYVVTLEDDVLEMTQYSECRVLVDGESVLQIDHLSPQDDYEAEADLAADVLDSLVIPGAESDDEEDAGSDEDAADSEAAADDESESTPASDDEDDETADDSDDTPLNDEESEPTESASDDSSDEDGTDPSDVEASSDDADAEATVEPDTGEDETDADAEATEEAAPVDEGDDQNEPEEEVDPDDLEGVDEDTYTSPTFGYTLEWDADEWTATSATSDDDIDTLVLENEITVLTIVGTEEFGENLDRCVRAARRGVEGDDGIEDLVPVEDANGDPIEIDEDERAGAVYTIVTEDEDAPSEVAQIECRVAIPGEAVIQIVQITPAAEFNDQIDPVAAILDSIAPEGEEQEETPTPEEEPTPDDAENETGESAVDGNAYVSPNFGFTIEWDEDVWSFAEGDESSEPGFDTLFLESSNSGLGIIGTELADPEACVSDFSSFIRTENDVDDWAPFEDEDGERIEGERDGGYFAAFSATITQTGQEFDIIYYFECRTVVEGESVVLFFMTTSPNAYDDATAELDDLLDTLTLPDEGDDDRAEETPAADDEEDADPTPEDEDDVDADSTASGADLDTYTDPDFPFSVTWDEGVWQVIDQRTIADGHNLLNLTAEGSDLTIEGWARWDGEPTDCLNDITLNLRAVDGVEDFERVSDSDLYPENQSRTGAYALYSFTLAPEGRTPVDYYGYVECRTVVEGEAVVVLTLLVPVDEYDDIRPEFEPILAGIEIEE